MNHWIVLALISALLFSLKDILAKKLFNHHEMKADNAVIQEYVGYLIITVFFIGVIDWSTVLSLWPLFLLKSLMIGCAGFLYFHLLEKHDISMTAPLMNLSPAFLLIFSLVFLSEAVSWVQIGGVLLVVLATYYLEVVLHHHNYKKAHKKHWVTLCKKDFYFFGTVLAMLITVSITAILDKLLLAQVNWQSNLFFVSLVILLTFAVIKKPKRILESIKLFNTHPKTIIFVILHTLSTIFILMAIAVPTALVSLIIPIRRTSSLFTSLFGGLLFHEDHIIKKMITVFVMLLGIMLIVL